MAHVCARLGDDAGEDRRALAARYGRTDFVRQLLKDVEDGAHSLGELDFARLCRLRDLPEPVAKPS